MPFGAKGSQFWVYVGCADNDDQDHHARLEDYHGVAGRFGFLDADNYQAGHQDIDRQSGYIQDHAPTTDDRRFVPNLGQGQDLLFAGPSVGRNFAGRIVSNYKSRSLTSRVSRIEVGCSNAVLRQCWKNIATN